MEIYRDKIYFNGKYHPVDFTSNDMRRLISEFHEKYPSKKPIFDNMITNLGLPNNTKFLIERRFLRSLEELLQEEMGVSMDSYYDAEKIYEQLLASYNEFSHKLYNFSEDDERPVEFVNFSYNFEGENLSIQCKFVHFDSDIEMMSLSGRYGIGASIDPEKKIIEINCGLVNNTIEKADIIDSINHELLHFYQYKFNSRLFPEKTLNRYLTAIEQGETYNPLSNQRAIADLVYIMNGQEVTAYVNGLYAYLMNNPYFIYGNIKQQKEAYLNSHFYKCFFEFKSHFLKVNEVKDKKGIQNYTYSTYNTTIFVILKFAEKMLKTMEAKGHKIFYKALQDVKAKQDKN